MQVLTGNPDLIRLLTGWLTATDDVATLQRLGGVFHHLSRSPKSARTLSDHGALEALRQVSGSKQSGSPEAREALVGLVNMAMANIVVRQQHQVMQIAASQIGGIRTIVRFLQLALHNRPFSGIFFRYEPTPWREAEFCEFTAHDKPLDPFRPAASTTSCTPSTRFQSATIAPWWAWSAVWWTRWFK